MTWRAWTCGEILCSLPQCPCSAWASISVATTRPPARPFAPAPSSIRRRPLPRRFVRRVCVAVIALGQPAGTHRDLVRPRARLYDSPLLRCQTPLALAERGTTHITGHNTQSPGARRLRAGRGDCRRATAWRRFCHGAWESPTRESVPPGVDPFWRSGLRNGPCHGGSSCAAASHSQALLPVPPPGTYRRFVRPCLRRAAASAAAAIP